MRNCAACNAGAFTLRNCGRCSVCLFAVIVVIAVFAACGSQPASNAGTEPGSAAAPPEKTPVQPVRALIEMISVPGGSFSMGSPKGTAFSLDIERPVHQVTVGGFFLGKYEVTQGQFFEVMGTRPSNFITNADDPGPDGWMKLPVEMVNWYETLVFCNRLSIKEKLSPVYRINGSTDPDTWGPVPRVKNAGWDAVEMIGGADGYRLPTESEWEYAARGGSAGPKNATYAGSSTAGTVSWYYDNSGFRIHEIGTKAPNELGLYDMSGNAMEWCWDWLGGFDAENKDNPTGPATGQYRVIRGGGWSVSVHYSRVPYRHNNLPSYQGVNLGFRVARSS